MVANSILFFRWYFFSKVRRAAKVEMDGHFSSYSVVYKDEVMFNLTGTAVNILDTQIQDV